jgi:VWFA-related protein
VPIHRRSLGISSVALCLAALGTAGLGQSPQPTFRSTVDLLTIETSVRDKGGQPVPDLQASDFTITIDGRPRKIVSSLFFKAEGTGARLTAGAAPTPQYVSNDRTQPGRVVIFWVDGSTIRAGQERALFETASRMLDGLSPADAVGFLDPPFPGIEITRDHSAVVEVLKRFVGRAHWAEAGARGGKPQPNAGQARGGGQDDLANLVRGLAVVRAPRSVILISGGIAFDPKLSIQYKELERAAAESRVTLYTVLLEEVGYEASRRGETEYRPDIAENPGKTDGLATIASMTGGMFFNAAGRAGGIFDRIQSEINYFYQLAIESSPADADGKPHDLKVRVNRAGVDVRAPSHVAVARPPKAAPARDRLADALQQPIDVPDVPLAVSTYSSHAAGGSFKVLVSAEIGAPNAAAPVEWGFAVSQRGKDAIVRRGSIPADSEHPYGVSTTMDLPPGDYRVRVAAVDVEGRVGVLEMPFTAGYKSVAGAMISDLVVGAVTAGEFEPRRRLARTEEVIATMQVLAGAGTVTSGVLQLIPAGSARSVLNIPLAIRPPSSAGAPTTLQARASLAAVPAGRYTVSAALEMTGQPIARVDRVIEITATPVKIR